MEMGKTITEETESATRAAIDRLRDDVSKWLHIEPEDLDLIDFALAGDRSNLIPGDPLWAIIIDASGGGKTELLRALRGRPETYFLSSLTENSLMSGYRDPANPGQDPSLLPHLDGKVLTIKDLSPLLTMRREKRNIIIGQLRDAYDGFTDQAYGNVGHVSYQAKFSLLAASTLAVENFESVNQELGERFIKFRVRSPEAEEKIRKAIANFGKDDPMRSQIKTAVWDFLDSLPEGGPPSVLPEKYWGLLTDLSDFTAKARSHVPRDKCHNLLYKPKPEIGTRLGKELAKLLLSLADVRGKSEPDDADLRTVIRVAEDCLPPNRLAILGYLRDRYFLVGEPAQTSEIAAGAGLPESTIKQALEDLHILGLVRKEIQPLAGNVSTALWELEGEWGEKLTNLWVEAGLLTA
jgi:hypothetical protein